MSSLYFECNSGISGDMSVAALIDLGADKNKLYKALNSMNLNKEFEYNISDVMVNSIKATDFDVKILSENTSHNHSHIHRNLEDINKIIDKIDASENAKKLAKKIFNIVADAESKVHNKKINEIHFHEIGAIDSIADIVSFAVLFDDISPDKVYFSRLTEGQGTIKCQHGDLSVPVPAVCEIASKYSIPIKMVTPTGIAIVASLYDSNVLPETIVLEKIGYGAGKRPYPNPVLRIMKIKEI
jgi:uncharacterized protein (TIGR00299 family) protein